MIERLQCCYISPDDSLTAPRPASVRGNTRASLALPRAQQGPRASCSKAWREPGIAFRLNRLYANKLRFSSFYVTKRPFLHRETSRCSRRNGPYWLRRQPQLSAGSTAMERRALSRRTRSWLPGHGPAGSCPRETGHTGRQALPGGGCPRWEHGPECGFAIATEPGATRSGECFLARFQAMLPHRTGSNGVYILHRRIARG